jgi:peroxiredoxin
MFYSDKQQVKLFEEKSPINSPAHNFRVITLKGDTIQLKNLEGKVVVVCFFFAACAPCISEIPELNKLVKKYKDKQIEFIAISTSDSKTDLEDLQKFIQEKRKEQWLYTLCPAYDYEILGLSFKSSNRQIANETYSTNTMPSHIIIDPKGLIRYRQQGYKKIYITEMENILDSLFIEK